MDFVVEFVLGRVLEVDVASQRETAGMKAQDCARQQKTDTAEERLVPIQVFKGNHFGHSRGVDDAGQPWRLRHSAQVLSIIEVEFGPEARARRARARDRMAADLSMLGPKLAAFIGPENVPGEVFTPEARAALLA